MDSTNKPSKILSDLVEVGKELPVNVYTHNGFLLLKRGHYVLNPETKQKLLQLGFEMPKEDKTGTEKFEPKKRESYSVFEDIAHLHIRIRSLLKHTFTINHLELRIREIADTIITYAEKQPNGLIASIFLVPFSDYSTAHALHTASLLAILTRRISLPSNHRQTLICAAITMNLALFELQNELYSQSSVLNDEQKLAIKDHPLLSSAILREVGIEDQLWHTLIQTHHESWVGDGYPFGLHKDDILPPSHLLHMADITCAKLTPRRYRAGLLPATALGQIFQRKTAEFDSEYTTMLIKELGIYPPGSFVKLASNEIGVVVAPGNKPNEPQVAAIRKLDGPPYGDPLLRETRQPGYKVLSPCSASESKVRVSYLAKLWKT